MTDPQQPVSFRTRLIRRLIPLAILGSAVALVVAQLSKAVSHEVTLELELAKGLSATLSTLELQVISDEEQVVSLTQFRFDQTHRPADSLTHTLRLTSGDYRLILKGQCTEAVEFRRQLKVDGDTLVRYHFP